jgi:hypothetical protein
VPSGYWGYSYSYFSYGDYLHGAADVIRSQGQFLINKQEANILREKFEQEKFVTRRKETEHWRWERDFKNEAYEQERKRIREMEFQRDINDPAQTQVLGATTLNLLLSELKKVDLARGASVTIDQECLPHINITWSGSGTGGNVGLLKGDKIAWPLFLRQEEYAKDRERIENLLAEAKKEAIGGETNADTLLETRKQIKLLEQRVSEELKANRNDLWSPSDFVRATRSLKEFASALQMLERPDAAFYLTPLQGRTVAELVELMKNKGLSFAPATTGSERFYFSLRQALASELMARRSPGGQ